jgi:hypothetical protein
MRVATGNGPARKRRDGEAVLVREGGVSCGSYRRGRMILFFSSSRPLDNGAGSPGD